MLAAVVVLLLLVVALTGTPYIAVGAVIVALGVFAVGGTALTPILGTASEVLLSFVLVVPAALLAAGLVLFRFRQRMSDAWPAVPYDMRKHDLPAKLREFGRQGVSRLEGIGFHVVADLFSVQNEKGPVAARVIVLENADGTETATVVAHFAGGGAAKRTITFLEYATRNAEGKGVRATNNFSAGLWAQLPHVDETAFPEEHDPVRIVQIGRALRDRGLSGPYAPADHQGDVVAHIRKHLNQQYDYGVERGRLVHEASRGWYRPSWRGALILALGFAPPFGWIRTVFVNRAARRTLAELGIEPPPPPLPTAVSGKSPMADSTLGPAILATAFVMALLWWFTGGFGGTTATADVGPRYEAGSWLAVNENPSALASNRFGSTDSASAYVRRLYDAGAEVVYVSNVMADAQTISDEGGPYADVLVVVLPEDPAQRAGLFGIINAELLREGFDTVRDRRQSEVLLWWD